MTTQLFANQKADGSSYTFDNYSDVFTVFVAGEFGGATVTLQCSPDKGGTWLNAGFSTTEPSVSNIVGAPGILYRLFASATTASSALNAWVAQK